MDGFVSGFWPKVGYGLGYGAANLDDAQAITGMAGLTSDIYGRARTGEDVDPAELALVGGYTGLGYGPSALARIPVTSRALGWAAGAAPSAVGRALPYVGWLPMLAQVGDQLGVARAGAIAGSGKYDNNQLLDRAGLIDSHNYPQDLWSREWTPDTSSAFNMANYVLNRGVANALSSAQIPGITNARNNAATQLREIALAPSYKENIRHSPWEKPEQQEMVDIFSGRMKPASEMSIWDLLLMGAGAEPIANAFGSSFLDNKPRRPVVWSDDPSKAALQLALIEWKMGIPGSLQKLARERANAGPENVKRMAETLLDAGMDPQLMSNLFERAGIRAFENYGLRERTS